MSSNTQETELNLERVKTNLEYISQIDTLYIIKYTKIYKEIKQRQRKR